MNRIKIMREELGLTQQELADKIAGAKSTIAMYENETRKPSLEVLVRLSEIFNCSIDYLLGKSDMRNPKEDTKLEDLYMHLAKEAQDLKLDEEDVEHIIGLYKKYKK